ncbi:MAG: hypothetical protein M1817_005061 [Caeruleum heppii]|nr:MAG: hypothetical protein M1817_005061 [Caeruleum heppii]
MADIPPNELRYQQENIHEDQSQELSAFFIVCIVLSLLFPALRFASRKSGGSALKADDYTLLVGVILAQASFVVLLIYTFEAGLGKHVIALTPKQLILFPKLNYAYNILNVSCYPFIKISILLLYLRIFPAHRFRQIVWAGIAVLVCILISHTLVCIFACRPVQGFWKTDVSSKCINAVRFYWAQATLNVITDVFILLLPIPATWSLRITRRQKVGLSGLFMLGGLTCILSIVRITPSPPQATAPPPK